MPSTERTETLEFDAGWTRYGVVAPPDVMTVIEPVTVTTPQFVAPTHRVEYRITDDDTSYCLFEQGDEVGRFTDPGSVAATIDRRLEARLHQIAAGCGWAPVRGALVAWADRCALVIAAGNGDDQYHDEIRRVVWSMSDAIGLGTCLLKPGQATVVGRSPHTTTSPADHRSLPATLTDVVAVDSNARAGDVSSLATPELIGDVLRAVINRSLLPMPLVTDAIRTATGAPAWRVSLTTMPDTVRGLLAGTW